MKKIKILLILMFVTVGLGAIEFEIKGNFIWYSYDGKEWVDFVNKAIF